MSDIGYRWIVNPTFNIMYVRVCPSLQADIGCSDIMPSSTFHHGYRTECPPVLPGLMKSVMPVKLFQYQKEMSVSYNFVIFLGARSKIGSGAKTLDLTRTFRSWCIRIYSVAFLARANTNISPATQEDSGRLAEMVWHSHFLISKLLY